MTARVAYVLSRTVEYEFSDGPDPACLLVVDEPYVAG
jgi:hypothetical protein